MLNRLTIAETDNLLASCSFFPSVLLIPVSLFRCDTQMGTAARHACNRFCVQVERTFRIGDTGASWLAQARYVVPATLCALVRAVQQRACWISLVDQPDPTAELALRIRYKSRTISTVTSHVHLALAAYALHALTAVHAQLLISNQTGTSPELVHNSRLCMCRELCRSFPTCCKLAQAALHQALNIGPSIKGHGKHEHVSCIAYQALDRQYFCCCCCVIAPTSGMYHARLGMSFGAHC